MSRDQKNMPDVPTQDFVDAICEIWFTVNFAAYHLAYTRVYLQTRAMQTPIDELLRFDQLAREQSQIDLNICRSHLAAFFWELFHVFEALEFAVGKGKKEHPGEKYFYVMERHLDAVRKSDTAMEIAAYRNEAHNIPAIIGQAWEGKGGRFLHHHLPTITGHRNMESIDLNDQLQKYFEFVANLWLSFVPESLKSAFPGDFSYPVTVPFFYLGELPDSLKGAAQLLVSLQAYLLPAPSAGPENSHSGTSPAGA